MKICLADAIINAKDKSVVAGGGLVYLHLLF
jgi:hypothetical protein